MPNHKAHKNSPNGCFERHGYTIERVARTPNSQLKRRIIRNPSGAVVLDGVGYDDEIAYCKANRMLVDE